MKGSPRAKPPAHRKGSAGYDEREINYPASKSLWSSDGSHQSLVFEGVVLYESSFLFVGWATDFCMSVRPV